ncbi:hypothetical protein IWX90DRAFT_63800 [Phyllosticta citrichinensis]|uniref:Secreted protein n=1 Tax=Phyllosticta citrichinensis TaxID=1130410 RepID=A0ABR1XHA4_9PEZI
MVWIGCRFLLHIFFWRFGRIDGLSCPVLSCPVRCWSFGPPTEGRMGRMGVLGLPFGCVLLVFCCIPINDSTFTTTPRCCWFTVLCQNAALFSLACLLTASTDIKGLVNRKECRWQGKHLTSSCFLLLSKAHTRTHTTTHIPPLIRPFYPPCLVPLAPWLGSRFLFASTRTVQYSTVQYSTVQYRCTAVRPFESAPVRLVVLIW